MLSYLWEDKELRFDLPRYLLTFAKGEFLIDSINSVEDTKGNNGEQGSLSITNLRILWISHKNTTVNLSIGLKTINQLSIRKASSKQRGSVQALFLTAKMGRSKFEFIFTSLVANSPRLFTTVRAVYRSYESSPLYREVKLRGSLFKRDKLQLLPDEETYETVLKRFLFLSLSFSSFSVHRRLELQL